MKTMTVNPNSWHFKLAEIYMPTNYREWRNMDICWYTRLVLLGGFQFLLLVVIGIFLTICVGDFLAWTAVLFVIGWASPNIFASVVLMIVGVIGIVWLGGLSIKGLEKTKETVSNIEFIRESYDALKNRYCFKVEILNQDDSE